LGFFLFSEIDKFAFKMVDGKYPTFGRLKIVNATHAHWELLAGSAFTKSESDGGGQVEVGSVLDSLWIVQEKHGKFQLSDLPSDKTQEINQNMVGSSGQAGNGVRVRRRVRVQGEGRDQPGSE
jgi:hypothetical protein